jgi:hypothetical protein
MKISVTLQDKLRDELKTYCADKMGDMPISAFLRYAAKQYMDRHPAKPKDIKKNTQ